MAKWSRAYIDSLPDSAFLTVLPGGKKDDEGKTVPRSKRKFPVRDKNGKLDKPHIDDALSRIPDSNISQSLKERVQAKAQRLLSEWKKANGMKKSVGKLSYNDLRTELQSIVQQKYGRKSKDGDWFVDYPWIVDVYEDEFVVEKNGKYYMADYTVDDENTVEIGDFYPARKVYNRSSKTPVKTLGKGVSNPSIAVER